jgi:hypothetical protein
MNITPPTYTIPASPAVRCDGKRRHPDMQMARAFAYDIMDRDVDVKVLFIYHCPECGGWHVTNSKGGGSSKFCVSRKEMYGDFYRHG